MIFILTHNSKQSSKPVPCEWVQCLSTELVANIYDDRTTYRVNAIDVNGIMYNECDPTCFSVNL